MLYVHVYVCACPYMHFVYMDMDMHVETHQSPYASILPWPPPHTFAIPHHLVWKHQSQYARSSLLAHNLDRSLVHQLTAYVSSEDAERAPSCQRSSP